MMPSLKLKIDSGIGNIKLFLAYQSFLFLVFFLPTAVLFL